MAYLNPTKSINSLNVNGLDTPIKRQIGRVNEKEPKYILSTINFKRNNT